MKLHDVVAPCAVQAYFCHNPLCRAAQSYVVTRAVRKKSTYKIRKDGTRRVFGGVNILMYGDWWQLKPVDGTWLCCNPLDIPAGHAQNALEILRGGRATTPYVDSGS